MTKQHDVQHLPLAGEFNIFTAAAMRERMLAALGDAEEIEVDLSQVTEMDSAGVQLMVAAKEEAEAQRKVLRFTGHSAVVLDTLELCGLAVFLGGATPLHSHA